MQSNLCVYVLTYDKKKSKPSLYIKTLKFYTVSEIISLLPFKKT